MQIRINLQNPDYKTPWDKVHSYLISKIIGQYKLHRPEYFMLTKEESNLRLLEYDEEITTLKLSLTSSVDTKPNSSPNPNS